METIGSRLKTAREKRNMKPSDVAKAVRMKTQYVEAIDKNEFHVLIAPIYAKGFIRLYAEYVGLDPAPLVRQFNEIETAVPSEPARQDAARQAAGEHVPRRGSGIRRAHPH